MEKKVVDARGLSCPQPVLLTKQALASKEKLYEVLVDNGTAKENVTRFARNSGYAVEVSERDGDYVLTLSK